MFSCSKGSVKNKMLNKGDFLIYPHLFDRIIRMEFQIGRNWLLLKFRTGIEGGQMIQSKIFNQLICPIETQSLLQRFFSMVSEMTVLKSRIFYPEEISQQVDLTILPNVLFHQTQVLKPVFQ